MSSRIACALLLLSSVAAISCGDDTSEPPGPDPVEVQEGCNPIGAGIDCLLPYPSDYFRVDGEGGVRVRVPAPAQIVFESGPVDLLALHRPDGFSVGTPILVSFGAAVSDADLVFWTDDTSRSQTAESPTVLIDAETGQPVEHFAELDPRATDPTRQALIIRPLVRLEPSRRYVVGVHGLTTPEGEALAAPAGFASVRDDEGKGHPSLEALSPHYEQGIFPLLEGAGVERADLQLAWDFTTRSEADATGDMLAIREDVIARLADAPPEIEIRSVEEDVNERIARRIEFTVRVPLYLKSAEPGASLNGSPPEAVDVFEVPATVWVPPSVRDRKPGDPPARLLQFGHGFFGERYEADDFAAEFANERGFVVVAADWWGMSAKDRSFVIGALIDDPGNALVFTDRVHQAMANFMYVAAAAVGPLAEIDELQIAGAPAYATDATYFYGISMGHILGGTYVALSPQIERAALGVGGANFSLMLFRAQPFQAFLALLELQVTDKLEQQKFAVFAQSVFERIDPMTYAPFVSETPLAGSPVHAVAMQMGVADAAVPNLGTYFHAQCLGATVLEDAANTWFPSWLDAAPSPVEPNGFTPFDFGFEPEVLAVPASESNDVHNIVRHVEASKAQIDAFFTPNATTIDNACSGTCDPE